MLLDPRYRADCSELFAEPHEDDQIDFRGPDAVIRTLEESACSSDRTFNAQLLYVFTLCMGGCSLSPEDTRTVEEWKAIMKQTEVRFYEHSEWLPCGLTFGHARGQSGKA